MLVNNAGPLTVFARARPGVVFIHTKNTNKKTTTLLGPQTHPSASAPGDRENEGSR
jgi:hypothetical protein